jgi:hypothetical protein
MANHDLLERAFALADSGKVRTVRDICGALLREQYSQRDVGQLAGRALSLQLRARMRAAKKSE